MALLPSDIRRMAEEPAVVRPNKEELDKQVAEYLAKGGKIEQVPTGKCTVDFSVSHKPGETYGKHAY